MHQILNHTTRSIYILFCNSKKLLFFLSDNCYMEIYDKQFSSTFVHTPSVYRFIQVRTKLFPHRQGFLLIVGVILVVIIVLNSSGSALDHLSIDSCKQTLMFSPQHYPLTSQKQVCTFNEGLEFIARSC